MRLLPRDERFFDLFIAVSQRTVEAAGMLEDLLRADVYQRIHFVDSIKRLEHECDQITHEVVTRLDRTFITPLDREDIHELVNQEPFNSLFDMQRIGRYKPNAPVMILSNRYDPLVPWTAANQLGRDWCAQGADVQFWTNEEPPFLNKAIVNHALPMLVDGERAMQWVADRFNGLPTTPNCGEF